MRKENGSPQWKIPEGCLRFVGAIQVFVPEHYGFDLGDLMSVPVFSGAGLVEVDLKTEGERDLTLLKQLAESLAQRHGGVQVGDWEDSNFVKKDDGVIVFFFSHGQFQFDP